MFPLSAFVTSKPADRRELQTYFSVAKQARKDTVSDLIELNDSKEARASTFTSNYHTRDLELHRSVLMNPMTWKTEHFRTR